MTIKSTQVISTTIRRFKERKVFISKSISHGVRKSSLRDRLQVLCRQPLIKCSHDETQELNSHPTNGSNLRLDSMVNYLTSMLNKVRNKDFLVFRCRKARKDQEVEQDLSRRNLHNPKSISLIKTLKNFENLENRSKV